MNGIFPADVKNTENPRAGAGGGAGMYLWKMNTESKETILTLKARIFLSSRK